MYSLFRSRFVELLNWIWFFSHLYSLETTMSFLYIVVIAFASGLFPLILKSNIFTEFNYLVFSTLLLFPGWQKLLLWDTSDTDGCLHYFYHGTVNQDALPQLSFRDPLWWVWDYNLPFLLCNKQLVNTSVQSPLKQMLAVGGLRECTRQLCLGWESIYVHNVRPSENMWLMLAIGNSVICAIQRWGTLNQRWGTRAIVIKKKQPLKYDCNESQFEQ